MSQKGPKYTEPRTLVGSAPDTHPLRTLAPPATVGRGLSKTTNTTVRAGQPPKDRSGRKKEEHPDQSSKGKKRRHRRSAVAGRNRRGNRSRAAHSRTRRLENPTTDMHSHTPRNERKKPNTPGHAHGAVCTNTAGTVLPASYSEPFPAPFTRAHLSKKTAASPMRPGKKGTRPAHPHTPRGS